MPFKRPNWPPHIEHFNPEFFIQNFYDDNPLESDDEETTEASHRRGKFQTKNPATFIEHFNPIPLQPRPVSAAVEANHNGNDKQVMPSSPAKQQENKRRKISGSSKPQKLRPVQEENENMSSGAGRKPRQVQVCSQNGEVLHLFDSCSEAGRQMNVTRTRIGRGEIVLTMVAKALSMYVQLSTEGLSLCLPFYTSLSPGWRGD